jgi:hypothetical protein
LIVVSSMLFTRTRPKTLTLHAYSNALRVNQPVVCSTQGSKPFFGSRSPRAETTSSRSESKRPSRRKAGFVRFLYSPAKSADLQRIHDADRSGYAY